VDKPRYTSVPMDELRRIEAEVRRADTIDDLRPLFERLQAVRRRYVDDFDIQLAVGQVQQSIVDRGRLVRESTGGRDIYSRPESQREQTLGPREHVEASGVADRAQDTSDTALPPDVQRLDEGSWKRATYIGAFFAIILFAVFFYLVQTARRLNFAPEENPQKTAANQTRAGQQKPQPGTPQAAVPAGSSLRLYTDLVPGTVSVDSGPPQPLQDGQFQLDSLKSGKHTVKLTGSTGEASFDFEVDGKTAPHLVGQPSGTNALIVTVSTQEGLGRLMTNAQAATALVDNAPAGAISADGLELQALGKVDHDLQIKRANDSQRFVLTYTSAPALTVYVKSDPNAGSLLVAAGEDGADISIDGQHYKRKTERGQLRIPSLKAGTHNIKISKPGFMDLPAQTVQVKKGEEARIEFHLQPLPQVAVLQIRGAQPGTLVFVDKQFGSVVGGDGNSNVGGIKPGDHTIELRRDGEISKQILRPFKAGVTVTLSGPDVALEKIPAPQPLPAVQPGATQADAAKEAQPEEPVAEAQPVTLPASIHKGGGFLIYHTTKASGHYSFSLQLRKGGGFLKSKRLQWFLGFQNTKNYVLFQVDGKHFTVRQVVDGKGDELQKSPFDAELESYVQVEVSVKPNSVNTRLKPSEGGWQDMGPVTVMGRNFTQGKFGILISGNDEIAISPVHFGK
jgi:hypothetical protein